VEPRGELGRLRAEDGEEAERVLPRGEVVEVAHPRPPRGLAVGEHARKGVRDLVTWFVGAPSHTTYHVPRRGNRGSLPISPTKDSRGVKKLGCIGCAPLGVEWLGTTHCCTLTS
jgi:hypothetical protein